MLPDSKTTAKFDRQIRLYGLDSQSKLSSSRVLVIGNSESLLVEETLKNLLLAGIGFIDLLSKYTNSSPNSLKILSNSRISLLNRCSQLNQETQVTIYQDENELKSSSSNNHTWSVVIITEVEWNENAFVFDSSKLIWSFVEGSFGMLKHGKVPTNLLPLRKPANATKSLIFWLAKWLHLDHEKVFEMLKVAPFECENGPCEFYPATCSILSGFTCQLAIRIITGSTAIWEGNCLSLDCSEKSLCNCFEIDFPNE